MTTQIYRMQLKIYPQNLQFPRKNKIVKFIKLKHTSLVNNDRKLNENITTCKNFSFH